MKLLWSDWRFATAFGTSLCELMFILHLVAFKSAKLCRVLRPAVSPLTLMPPRFQLRYRKQAENKPQGDCWGQDESGSPLPLLLSQLAHRKRAAHIHFWVSPSSQGREHHYSHERMDAQGAPRCLLPPVPWGPSFYERKRSLKVTEHKLFTNRFLYAPTEKAEATSCTWIQPASLICGLMCITVYLPLKQIYFLNRYICMFKYLLFWVSLGENTPSSKAKLTHFSSPFPRPE